MQKVTAFSLALVMSAVVLSGCAKSGQDDPGDDAVDDGLLAITHVQDRHKLPFATNASAQPWSHVLTPGPLEILPGVGKTIQIDIPLGSGAPTADVHMGLFFPDIEGCDWAALMAEDPAPEAGMLPFPVGHDQADPCRLPVVSDVGPYYGEPVLGDLHATEPANRLGRFLIENLVPHGYIVAQVSVTGTGDSTGCMDLMGPIEQEGVQEAVRYLGRAGFSNGAVALTGRSYDGSTPWEAAMDPTLTELKTVVPISGLYGQLDLMWKNGSVETRGPGVLWGLYYAFTYTGNDPVSGAVDLDSPLLIDPDRINSDPDMALLQARQIAENLVCPETQAGGALAAASYVYGGDPASAAMEEGSYWETRSFADEVLQNYRGSVYFIHGMQDWNVDPHMAFPFYQQLEQNGLEMKGLFGQWGHQYPDRVGEHPENLRWDWAQDLLEWFDHYLKGTGAKPQLHVEMEDDHNQWRIESTWPPQDLQWHNVELDGGDASMHGNTVQTGGPGAQVPSQACTGVSEACYMVFGLGVQDAANDTRYAGLAKFHVGAIPQGPGGQLYAELRDATDNRRLTHAIMDLRYHEGGMEQQVVVPGVTITAMMEFFPADVVLPAGHELELVVRNTSRDYLPSVVSTPVVVEDAVLKLPVVERDGTTYFTPPGWEESMSTTATLG